MQWDSDAYLRLQRDVARHLYLNSKYRRIDDGGHEVQDKYHSIRRTAVRECVDPRRARCKNVGQHVSYNSNNQTQPKALQRAPRHVRGGRSTPRPRGVGASHTKVLRHRSTEPSRPSVESHENVDTRRGVDGVGTTLTIAIYSRDHTLSVV